MENEILHCVIFQVAPGVDKARIEKVKNMFLDLQQKISGIQWITWQTNNSKSKFAQGWQEGCFMLFRDLKARDHFLEHPEHKKVSAETGNGFYTSLVVFDCNYTIPLQNI